ncbi:MAG: hypothetical protein DRJ09_13115, partial [Bacteroidetes bacterium]
TISNNWHTGGNWSNNQVPDSNSPVTIPSSGFYDYYPEVSSSTLLNKLFLNDSCQIIKHPL